MSGTYSLPQVPAAGSRQARQLSAGSGRLTGAQLAGSLCVAVALILPWWSQQTEEIPGSPVEIEKKYSADLRATAREVAARQEWLNEHHALLAEKTMDMPVGSLETMSVQIRGWEIQPGLIAGLLGAGAVAALVAGAVATGRPRWNLLAHTTAAALCAAAVVLGALGWRRVPTFSVGEFLSAGAGAGVWLTVFGGLLAVATGAAGALASRRRTQLVTESAQADPTSPLANHTGGV